MVMVGMLVLVLVTVVTRCAMEGSIEEAVRQRRLHRRPQTLSDEDPGSCPLCLTRVVSCSTPNRDYSFMRGMITSDVSEWNLE